MTKRRRPRVLAAGSGPALQMMACALGDDVRLIRARSAQDALDGMAGGVDLVLADLRFGRSRLLRVLHAARARHGSAFVDVRELSRRYGEPLAAEILRQLVRLRLQELQPRAASLSTR